MTIVLPKDTAQLDGLKSSDDVEIGAFQWILTSGSDDVIMEDQSTPVLKLSNLKEGQYEFTLTVVDSNNQTDSDSVVITVTGVHHFQLVQLMLVIG